MYKQTLKLKLFILIAVVLIAFFLDVIFGSTVIPFNKVINAILHRDITNSFYEIIWNIRLPRAITAILVGIGLSVCGLLMQTLFRNPLAGPYVLGVSSGASLGVAIILLYATSLATQGSIVIAAFVGAFSVLSVIFFFSLRLKNHLTVLILGVMMASLIGAIESFLQYTSNANDLKKFVLWGMGSFTNTTWSDTRIMLVLIIIGFGITQINYKKLNLFLLGEYYALSSGVNVKKTRVLLIIASGLLVATITAFCGPIAFIGIAVPHLAKLFLKIHDHKWLIIGTALIGALITLVCDVITQIPIFSYSLPINVVTSILGAPVVMIMLLRNKT